MVISVHKRDGIGDGKIYTVKNCVHEKNKRCNKKMIKDTVRVNWMTKETFLYYDNCHLKSNDLEMDVETVFFPLSFHGVLYYPK